MPSPPTPPGTVTDPIGGQRAAGPHGELVDDARRAGLHVNEPPARGGGRVHGPGVGRGVPERRQRAGPADAYPETDALPALDV